jgi:hypothetical protein
MVETLTVVTALLLGDSLALAAPPTNNAPAKSPLEAANQDKALTAGLEEMLNAALKNNPDIWVAEAKLHEAEAGLNRTRLQVMQKVITFRHSLQTQRALVQEAEKNLKDLQSLNKKGFLPESSLRDAQAALEREKTKLATLEAEMPSLLGKLPQSVTQAKKPAATTNANTAADLLFQQLHAGERGAWQQVFTSQMIHQHLPWNSLYTTDPFLPGSQDHQWQAFTTGQSAPPQPARGAMADKIRQALDTVVTLDIKDKPIGEALRILQQYAHGIPFHKVLPEEFMKEKVTLQLEQVPLGAALQALEVSFPGARNPGFVQMKDDGLVLAVREYGILVTLKYQLPSHATLLYDFWKKPAVKESTRESTSGSETNLNVDRNPPAKDVEGEVKAIDAKTGYVTISLGTDAGVAKGNTLEVFRLKPQPSYLGTLQIVEARATDAVGKLLGKQRSLQVGDRVASRVVSH